MARDWSPRACATPAVQPPEMGQQCRRDDLAEGVGRAAQRRAGLRDVVLQEPRFGEQHPDGQLVLPCERCRAQRLREKLCRVGGVAPFERGLGARRRWVVRRH